MWFDSPDFVSYARDRARRCANCGTRVAPGDLVVEIERYKVPEHDIECKIYGDDGRVPMATRYLCEECGGLHYSLQDLGFCNVHYSDITTAMQEYREIYGQASNTVEKAAEGATGGQADQIQEDQA